MSLSHQKLWIVVDKIIPVVFLSIFHPPKCFTNAVLASRPPGEWIFLRFRRGKDRAQDMWLIPAFREVMGRPGRRTQQQSQDLTDT